MALDGTNTFSPQHVRYRLTAAVEGLGVAQAPFACETEEYRLGITLDPQGRIAELWADCRVENYRDHLPRFTPSESGPHALSIPAPPEGDKLLGILQYVESLGSFWMGISHVAWAEANLEWLPESADEESELSVLSVSTKLEYPGRPIPVDPQRVAGMLGRHSSLNYLVIPMSFYRQGLNDYTNHRYVNAFYSFYFFLEDLYGSGKTKNLQVLAAFKGSPQLMTAVAGAAAQLETAHLAEQRAELVEFLQALRCEFTPEGLTKFLVMIRGELHHFSQKSTRPKGHPLNQRDFRSVAFLTLSICLQLIPKLASGEPLVTA